MASWGWNFRATSGFIADSAGETYSLGAIYPETRNGITFGWAATETGNSRDRNAAIDRRFAGMVSNANTVGTPSVFRVDLPATGSYDIRLSLGDTSNLQTIDSEIGDNGTYTTISNNITTSADNFLDATGVNRTRANWPGSNAALTKIYTSTILQLRLGWLSAVGNSSCVTHLLISDSGGAGADNIYSMGQGVILQAVTTGAFI